METWYFETSAVNAFLEGRTPEDASATKQLQAAKRREWRLSPVTLWEILMTSDEDRRDYILHFCQHLFARELLPAPGELIISYIEQGMPKLEKRRRLISNTAIAAKWRELVDDPNRRFELDHHELRKRMKLIQGFTKGLFRLVQSNQTILQPNNSFAGWDTTLSSLVNALPFVRKDPRISLEQRLAYKIALHYILFILCAESDMDNKAIQVFWNRVGINGTLERIHYVVHELPTLVHRGPFIVMAYMTVAQLQEGYSRGVWYDSLHSMYLPYVDYIFTSDGHFQGLRGVLPGPIIQQKIQHMDDLVIKTHEPGSYIHGKT